MIITFQEIIDIIIMTAALGYIFSDVFSRNRYHSQSTYDPLHAAAQSYDWAGFWFACKVTAPAIILHEIGHKIVAISLGLQATFHAAYSWLGIGILLKLMNFGFIFFVPAYVSHTAAATPLQSAAIAFAGPGVNLLLWLGSWFVIKHYKIKKRHMPLLVLTKQINMFLFIFNMLPLGFFDGAKVFRGLIYGLGIL